MLRTDIVILQIFGLFQSHIKHLCKILRKILARSRCSGHLGNPLNFPVKRRLQRFGRSLKLLRYLHGNTAFIVKHSKKQMFGFNLLMLSAASKR